MFLRCLSQRFYEELRSVHQSTYLVITHHNVTHSTVKQRKAKCSKATFTMLDLSLVVAERCFAGFLAPSIGRRNRELSLESLIPCHDAQVVGLQLGSNSVRLAALAAKSEDNTTAPQRLQKPSRCESLDTRAGYQVRITQTVH